MIASRLRAGAGPASAGPIRRSAMSSPSPTVSRSSITSVTCGVSVESPSSRPAAPEEVIAASAPLWCRRWTFSSSRTEETIVASGLSSRAVRVTSTAVSSRSVATISAHASRTPAASRVSCLAALPAIATRPSAIASSRASGSGSMATICSGLAPLLSRVRTALRPLTPYPQTIVWSFKRLLQRARR
jgi:hypothetical protein